LVHSLSLLLFCLTMSPPRRSQRGRIPSRRLSPPVRPRPDTQSLADTVDAADKTKKAKQSTKLLLRSRGADRGRSINNKMKAAVDIPDDEPPPSAQQVAGDALLDETLHSPSPSPPAPERDLTDMTTATPTPEPSPSSPPPLKYNIEWTAVCGKRVLTKKHILNTSFWLYSMRKEAEDKISNELSADKRCIDSNLTTCEAIVTAVGATRWDTHLNKPEDTESVDDRVRKLEELKRKDIRVLVQYDIVTMVDEPLSSQVDPLEDHWADEINFDSQVMATPAVATQKSVKSGKQTATSQMKAALSSKHEMAKETNALGIEIGRLHHCNTVKCPHENWPCFVRDGIHVKLAGEVLVRWARAVRAGKATKLDPGDTFLAPFVNAARKRSLTEEIKKQKRRKRKRSSPIKPTAVEPAAGMLTGQQAPINNYYFAPGQQQMGMPFGMMSPLMPQTAGYGMFSPSLPGAGLAQVPSSPVHIEEEDEDILLEEYFRWLIMRRPARRQALEDIVAELQQHGVGFGQLKEIPENIWSDIGVEWGLKDSIIRFRKEYLRYRTRNARKASPSLQSTSNNPESIASTSSESGSDKSEKVKSS